MQALRVAVDVRCIANGVVPAGDGLEEALAIPKRASAQVSAVQMQEVERVVEQAAVAAGRQRCVKVVEVAGAAGAEGNHLAV